MNPKTAQQGRDYHTLNVRNVPHQVWFKAKCNAMESKVPFRDFVIHLLENSSPIQRPGAKPEVTWEELQGLALEPALPEE